MACTALLGPLAAAVKSTGGADEPPVHSLISKAIDLNLLDEPPMGLTENGSLTFLSTGNPCLDFFFHIVNDTPSDQLNQRLELSWDHHPLTTLKLICNLRGIRGTGKSDKENFYRAAHWLYENHPKTLAMNIKAFVEIGYVKDLPEILYWIMEGPDKRKMQREEWKEKKRARIARLEEEDDEDSEMVGEKKLKISKKKREGSVQNSEETSSKVEKEKARVLRKEREIAKAIKAIEKYKSDENYRLLYDTVCDVFADLLKSDLEHLKKEDFSEISLAAKWCPSVDSSYDKTLLICEGIAIRVFPRESDAEFGDLEEAHYVYRIRDRFRKQVLVPLHKALQLPEVYMSANQWNSLPYNRVPSVAMKNYKSFFVKHDKERFEGFLEKVKSGNAKIAAGALLPHEIIKSLNHDEMGKEVSNLQWPRMVEDLSKNGKLSNCLAVSDVSGSMKGTRMEVSVALGLLVSELSEEPWKGKIVTFSEQPEIHVIKGDTLEAKAEFVRNMHWGNNTNFQAIFDKMLEIAVKNKLSEDQMVKRLFVFSDMEFDNANAKLRLHYEQGKEFMKKAWETDYETIMRKFKECGYNRVPEIVFWNLRNSSSTPVVASQKGVALVSGFSKNLLKVFLEQGGILNPEDVMRIAIAGEEYQKLVVYD